MTVPVIISDPVIPSSPCYGVPGVLIVIVFVPLRNKLRRFPQQHHPPRTLAELRETLVEPSWNLTSKPPRTTPEPIWAETPKLTAVGEKEK